MVGLDLWFPTLRWKNAKDGAPGIVFGVGCLMAIVSFGGGMARRVNLGMSVLECGAAAFQELADGWVAFQADGDLVGTAGFGERAGPSQ
jgi:hypothetical protein